MEHPTDARPILSRLVALCGEEVDLREVLELADASSTVGDLVDEILLRHGCASIVRELRPAVRGRLLN